MALRSEVIDFVGMYFCNYTSQIAAVSEVSIVEEKVAMVYMRVLIKMIDAFCIERTGTAFYSMYFIPFFKQEFS